jgi:hypothetical protein
VFLYIIGRIQEAICTKERWTTRFRIFSDRKLRYLYGASNIVSLLICRWEKWNGHAAEMKVLSRSTNFGREVFKSGGTGSAQNTLGKYLFVDWRGIKLARNNFPIQDLSLSLCVIFPEN